MVDWYLAVCDEHKECCHIICNTNYRATFVYQEDKAHLINAFLNKHYSCNLKLINTSMDYDYLYEQNYDFINRRKSIQEIKNYLLENNKMLYEDQVEEIVNNMFRISEGT